jgi:hypothetical protein
MSNVTISMSRQLLESSRRYAQRHGTSLNALIRELLEREVLLSKTSRLQMLFDLVDEAGGGDSRGWKWNREELHEDRLR